MRSRAIAAIAVLVALLVAAPALLGTGPGAQAATGSIHPGVLLTSPAGRCTGNFIYSDGAQWFIGFAAHCAGTGEATDTDGCATRSYPLGTPVQIDGASRPGTLAYSSWAAMAAVGETTPVICALNDFALVRIHPADVGRIDPAIPHWGGPTGLRRAPLGAGETVYSYGNSPLRGGLALLAPKIGLAVDSDPSGWAHSAYTVSPGIPGDSGSGVVDAQGRAVGVLATIEVLPLVASNNFTDLSLALRYMYDRDPGLAGVRVVPGGGFNGGQLPLDLG